MTDVGVTAASLSERVAEEVRVLLARRRMSAAALARELGVSQTYIWRRLEGQTAFDLTDLERIANALDVPVLDLIPSRLAGRSSGRTDLNASLRHFAEADPEPSPEPPRRHIATRPFSPPRRDPSHPVSAIPATKRRPGPVRPGNRLMTLRA